MRVHCTDAPKKNFLSLIGLARSLPFLGLFLFGLMHIVMILRYVKNVPMMDEWDEFPPQHITFHWLFSQHNEHRIVLTKLMTWLLYLLNGWDLHIAAVFNFSIYILLVISIFNFSKAYLEDISSGLVAFFMLFLFSITNIENHTTPFQSQFHFVLLFFVLSVTRLFRSQQRTSDLALGVLFAALSAYSFSSGVIFCGSLIFSYSAYKIARARQERQTNARREVGQLFFVSVVLLAIVISWFLIIPFELNPGHPALIFPYRAAFWRYFLNLISWGFGFSSRSLLLGAFCLGLIVTTQVALFYRQRGSSGSRRAASAAVLALVTGIISAQAVISLGRAGFGIDQAKSSRYAEVGMILVPCLMFGFWIIFDLNKHVRRRLLGCLAGFFFVGFFPHWGFSGYRSASWSRVDGLECITKYYRHESVSANCPSLYPEPITTRLENARQLRLSFYVQAVSSGDGSQKRKK